MILRKINAVLSLLCTVMFMDHAIFNAAWMLSRGTIPKDANSMPYILMGAMVTHAIISIILAILGHRGAEKRKCKGYASLNRPTYFQRFGGIALLIFTALHVAGTAGPLKPPAVIHAVIPPVFFAIALAHAAISTSKAFITLGIGSAKFIKAFDIVMKIICIATLIADVAGFYLYLA